MIEETFIEINKNYNLNLDSNVDEIEAANEVYAKLKMEVGDLKVINKINPITQDKYDKTRNDLLNLLEYVGELSIPTFKIMESIESQIINLYGGRSQDAILHWTTCYATLHEPYSILKNKIFRLQDTLNNIFHSAHGKYPEDVVIQ